MSARFFTLLALIASAASSAAGYTQEFRSGNLARWPANAEITFVVNSDSAPKNPPELVSGALLSAFKFWQTTMAANGIGVRFIDGGVTALNEPQCDQVNLVTFTKTLDPPLPSGVLAVARTFTTQGAGPAGGCGAIINAQFAGQIIDADLIFNTSLLFATVGLKDSIDIEPVTLHEVGHWLGLHHSGVNSAIMAPAGEAGSGFALRRLHPDDVAGINFAYSTNTGGAIAGRVTDGAGAAVLGAQVVATDATTGKTMAAALSGSDGRYRIVGLPQGAYRVFVEPLDGPIFLDEVSAAFQNGNTSFSTVFRSSTVSVGAGETGGIDFQIGALAMNAQFLGTSLGGLTITGSPPLAAKRGGRPDILVQGTGLSGEITFSAPADKVTLVSTSSPINQGFRRTVQIAADAPVGAIDVYIGSSALAGGLQIALNPAVFTGGVVEGASYNKTLGTTNHFAPGSIISIFGTDLAEETAFASALPLPTQLGGVSVRIGDRLAPIFFTSPGQINAMVPFEVSGTVTVQVIPGSNLSSNSSSITLGSSAPRIFSINSQGTGPGAILNGSKNNVLISETNPAAPGDVAVIFCEGLGVTSPVVVSGVASTAAQISAPLRVQIGGREAVVQYKGLAPGFAGLYQVNAVVPAGVSGNAVDVQFFNAAGEAGNTVTMAVR